MKNAVLPFVLLVLAAVALGSPSSANESANRDALETEPKAVIGQPTTASLGTNCCITLGKFCTTNCLVQCCAACDGLKSCMYCNIFYCNCEPCPSKPQCPCQARPDVVKSGDSNTDKPVNRGLTNFARIDSDADGNVTSDEVRRWWDAEPVATRPTLPEGFTLDDAFADADRNNDGVITFEESGCAAQYAAPD